MTIDAPPATGMMHFHCVKGLQTMNLSNHELSMTVLMTPDMANFAGNVHGGTILKLLDQVAYACASRYAGRYVVTLSVDQVTFRQPVHVGELVTFLASVNYTGTTSLEVGIKVITENIQAHLVRMPIAAFSQLWRRTRGAGQPPCHHLSRPLPTSRGASREQRCARNCAGSWRHSIKS